MLFCGPDPLVVRTAPSRGEPGKQTRFILKCFDDRSGSNVRPCSNRAVCRYAYGTVRQRDATGIRGPSECDWKQ